MGEPPSLTFEEFPEEAVYRELAEYYDDFYDDSDYISGAETIKAEVDRRVSPRAKDLLDVGAGTGRFARFLAPRFKVVALDPQPAMIARLHSWNPDAQAIVGDASSIDRDFRCDVITLLGGTIAYHSTSEALEQHFAALFGHLRPGGVILVDPWHTPASAARKSGIGVMKEGWGPRTASEPGRIGCRFSVLRLDGLTTRTQYWYVIQDLATRVLRAFTHPATLHVFETSTVLDALRDAGFERVSPVSTPDGFRALYAGQKPS